MKHQILNTLLISFFTCLNCVQDCIKPQHSSHSLFHFTMTNDQEISIHNRIGEKFSIVEPIPSLFYDGTHYQIDHFKIRGNATLDFKRKSFSLKLKKDIFFFIQNDNFTRPINSFKLISLVFDSTYIENSIALGLCRELDLWPLHSFYTEVKINENTKGLYLFIEDPEDYFLYKLNSNFILKRDYNQVVKDFKINNTTKTESFYINKYRSIYKCLKEFKGKKLYDTLLSYIDLEQYFKKIALDLLLQNGDAADEIYLYTKYDGKNEIFGICPWDYDDIFSQYPHEIGSDWSVGTYIKERYYYSMEDIINDVGEKLLFSIEDDLDYIIATDNFLYSKYIETLKYIFTNKITESVIEKILANTKNEIEPFYEDPDIIRQSKYDFSQTTNKLFYENIISKKEFLIQKRNWIMQKLDI